MTIREITVSHLRSHELFSVEIHPKLTLILGPNGAGKTTLLEAIYTLLRGSSFRGRDRDMIAHSQPVTDAKLLLDDSERRLRLQFKPDGKLEKSFTIEDRKTARLSPSHRKPVVLFDPDQLRLLTSSPTRRRDFIDGIISRLSPTYQAVLARYNRTLLQRNELLKQFEHVDQSTWESHLFAWDVKLAELGGTIIRARRNFLLQSNDRLTAIYQSISQNNQTVTATYLSPLEGNEQQLINELQSRHHSDKLRGFTSIGPHRDDITVLLNSRSATETASRGELRTIMLAFKLLEVELQEHHSGEKPLILLDDVFSELDTERETMLMETLDAYQTIITATDLREELKLHANTITLSKLK